MRPVPGEERFGCYLVPKRIRMNIILSSHLQIAICDSRETPKQVNTRKPSDLCLFPNPLVYESEPILLVIDNEGPNDHEDIEMVNFSQARQFVKTTQDLLTVFLFGPDIAKMIDFLRSQ